MTPEGVIKIFCSDLMRFALTSSEPRGNEGVRKKKKIILIFYLISQMNNLKIILYLAAKENSHLSQRISSPPMSSTSRFAGFCCRCRNEKVCHLLLIDRLRMAGMASPHWWNVGGGLECDGESTAILIENRF